MNFIFDLDGTICFKGQPISKRILDVLLELEDAGHFVGFASARPCRDMLPVLDDRFGGHLLIGANGAMTFYRKQPLAYQPIPGPLAGQIVNLLNDYEAEYLIDDTWNYAYRLSPGHPFLANVDPHGLARRVELDDIQSFVKIVVLSCSRFEELSAKLRALDVTIHHHSSEGILDVTSQGVNKMAALSGCGLQLDEFICFGNDNNDLPLFRKAKYSVLIGDHDALAELAKERIAVDDRTEENILQKLKELGTVLV
ncbi:HAD-IIB family hydrolase [Paenibacillus chitinolyticus]|uniref:HAD-IIB family hydrolase n=1 Tax=Paenibacillus chitinolyticus TaxID=79263 RepID=UPI00364097B0